MEVQEKLTSETEAAILAEEMAEAGTITTPSYLADAYGRGSVFGTSTLEDFYGPTTLTIGDTSINEAELVALKELLKERNPELYV